jgi:nitrile hydratase
MDGVHDMGGMHGFGAIPIDDGYLPFHETWQGRVFANNLALSVHTANVDRFRFLIESMPPAEYLSSSYYERWMASLLAIAEEKGFLDNDQVREIRAGQIPWTSPADTEAVSPAFVDMILNAPSQGARDLSGTPRFMVGDRVRAACRHTPGHVRLPRYVRGHPGEIVKDNGNQLFPDTHAHSGEVDLQRLYTVSFRATDLWGQDANPHDSVRLDLWEAYLDEL